MSWFKRQSQDLDTSGEKKVKTEGLWVKCEGCRQIIWKKDLEENYNVCPKCDKHFRVDARTRMAQLFDDGEDNIEDSNLSSTDPLKFTDLKPYASRLKAAQAATGLKDAIVNARGKINGQPVIISAMDDDESRARATAAGATAYYTKPFSPIALLDKVYALLG